MLGVIQCGRRLGFALKAGERLRVTGNIFWQELEGDEAMEPCVLSLTNYSHPTAAQLFDNAVVRDRLADHWAEMLGLRRGQVNEMLGVRNRLLRCGCNVPDSSHSLLAKNGVRISLQRDFLEFKLWSRGWLPTRRLRVTDSLSSVKPLDLFQTV
jgi:hypothetical protein